jgi:hypothetical protein
MAATRRKRYSSESADAPDSTELATDSTETAVYGPLPLYDFSEPVEPQETVVEEVAMDVTIDKSPEPLEPVEPQETVVEEVAMDVTIDKSPEPLEHTDRKSRVKQKVVKPPKPPQVVRYRNLPKFS